jgi:hypothetical protein
MMVRSHFVLRFHSILSTVLVVCLINSQSDKVACIVVSFADLDMRFDFR